MIQMQKILKKMNLKKEKFGIEIKNINKIQIKKTLKVKKKSLREVSKMNKIQTKKTLKLKI